MKPQTTVWGLLIATIAGSRLQKQYERVEDAIKRQAQCVSNAEFNRTMANFYTDRVLALNPHDIEQVWDFAAAKQKQHDHQTECVRYEHREIEARAVVTAETQRFHTLQEKGRVK